MKKTIYTPDFFKKLINRDSLELEVTTDNEAPKTSSFSRDLESIFSFFFSPSTK